MPLSDEMRRLQKAWLSNAGWPKRLNWIEVTGIRGWQGQRFEMRFPIMAIVGENGSGKSTILQAAAVAYRPSGGRRRYPYVFYPDTAWDRLRGVIIKYEYSQGGTSPKEWAITKPTTRWRGNTGRPERHVVYQDLGRIQPMASRYGYSKLSKSTLKEVSAKSFDPDRLARLGQIMGREYELAKMSLTDADKVKEVLVLKQVGQPYSGFHGGAGETVMAELLGPSIPDTAIVLIDEIESSLHPRTQRRLMRDLAALCRDRELQVLISTHSQTILDELPQEARAFIMLGADGSRQIVYGVSPEFAMSKMDDVPAYDCDLYVEDERARIMLSEILAAHARQSAQRCRIITYGAASVGKSLGQMVAQDRFPKQSRVFLDGDEKASAGCLLLPGGDAPERVVMQSLKRTGWKGMTERTGRPHAEIVDQCERAMTLSDHHAWVTQAATGLFMGGDALWQNMCAQWATTLTPDAYEPVTRSVQDAVDGLVWNPALPTATLPRSVAVEKPTAVPDLFDSARSA